MSHEKELIKLVEEVIILERIDDIIEMLELETQKAISMTALSVPILESFVVSMALIDELNDCFESITDELIKVMAFVKIKNTINEFEEKLSQIH